MADIVQIGIAYDTSQLVSGARQVQTALSQVEQADKRTQSATQALQQSSTHAAQALGQEARAAQATGHAMQTLTSQTHQATGAMQSLTRSLGTLVAGAVAFSTLKAGMEGVVSAALKLEGLNAAFKAITGSAEGAGAAMQFVRAQGERLGVQADAIAGSYKSLLAATQGTTLGLKETQTLFIGVVEASRALALSSEDTAGALRPLVQIISQGSVQADELRNELGSRLPGVMQLLVTASNGAFKSVGELTKAMEDGKLKGEAALDLMANFGIVLRQRFAPAAEAAAQGTAAAFARMQQAVTDLQVALGTALLPTLADVARALTGLMTTAQGTTSAFAQGFTLAIREAASMAIGLSGAVVVLGKYMAALGAGMAYGAEAWKAGWEDVKQTAADVTTAQQQMLNPPNLTRLNPKLSPLPGDYGALRPLSLGGGEEEKKRRGLTDAEKEANKVKQEQASLIKQITDAYEKELYTERQLTALELERAGLGDAQRTALMTRYDETQALKEMNDEEQKRKDLATDLQDALDKATFAERELLELRLKKLRFADEEVKAQLKIFDATEKLKQASEERRQAEEDAVQATKQQASEIERLMKQLEPRRRSLSRQEQLQGTMSELVDVTSDPYQLQKASTQMQETLDTELWHDWRDAGLDAMDSLSSRLTDFVFKGKASFKEFVASAAQDLFQLASQTTFRALFNSETVQGLFSSGLQLLGALGGGGGGVQTAAVAATSAIPRQHGGPAYAGTPYWVGEQGPELFVPRMSGTVLPAGQTGGGGPVVVNMHISTPNADSFQRSRGELEAQMVAAMQRAQRNA